MAFLEAKWSGMSCGMSTFDVTLLPLDWWNLAYLGCVEFRLWLTGLQGPTCGIGTQEPHSCGMSLSGLILGEGAGSHGSSHSSTAQV